MKFLLDTNTLLNAAFLQRSWSRRAVLSAQIRKDRLLVSNVILDEARRTIESATSGIELNRDPWKLVELFCSSYSVGTIYCGNLSGSSAIDAHDRHIEMAARQASAQTLTSDIDLARSLKGIGIPACYPLELVSRYEPGSLSTLFFGERPTSEAGSFFFRGMPNGGSGQSEEILEPFAWPSFSVRYSYPAAEWTVVAQGRCVLRTPYQLERKTDLELGLSWTHTKISLRLNDDGHPVTESLASPIGVDFTQVGQLVPRYMGTIFLATMDNRTLAKGMWRKARSDPPYSSPNPYDVDRVRDAIRVFASTS